MTSTSNQSGYHVFLASLNCSVEEFTRALTAQGMKPERADQVARTIPCYIKKNVARNVAVDYGNAFQRAGASIKIESAVAEVEVGLPLQVAPAPAPPAAVADLGAPAASALPMSVGPASGVAAGARPESARPAGGAAGVGPIELGSEASPLDLLGGSSPAVKLGLSAAPDVAPGSVGVVDLEIDAPSSPMLELGDNDVVALDLGEPAAGAALPLRNPAPAGLGAAPGGGVAPVSPSAAAGGGVAPASSSVAAAEIDLPAAEAVVGADSAKAGSFTAPGKKKLVIKAIPMPDPEPWIKRRYPHLIIGVILVLIASYLYGCTTIMASSVRLRREIGDVNRLLENMNARHEVVTDADVVAAVQEVGKKCGVDIASDDVSIFAEPLGQEQLGHSCRFAHTPDSFQKLSPVDQQMLMQAVKSCTVPDWILSVQISSKMRWGLFSHTVDATVHTWVRSYESE